MSTPGCTPRVKQKEFLKIRIDSSNEFGAQLKRSHGVYQVCRKNEKMKGP